MKKKAMTSRRLNMCGCVGYEVPPALSLPISLLLGDWRNGDIPEELACSEYDGLLIYARRRLLFSGNLILEGYGPFLWLSFLI